MITDAKATQKAREGRDGGSYGFLRMAISTESYCIAALFLRAGAMIAPQHIRFSLAIWGRH
jgi:hypothetical protein